MFKKICLITASLLMLPFIQGCDESDVATGVVVGAVVGGAVVAVATDSYDYNDHYYRNRYNNYYKHRRDRYSKRYGQHRYGDRYRRPGHGWGHGKRRGWDRRYIHRTSFTTVEAQANVSKDVMAFADFYQMPLDSAEVILSAKNEAMNGNLNGLVDIGIFAKDVKNLVDMKPASKDTVYRVSLRTGLVEEHVRDILVDFQQEFLAAKKAGLIQ